MHSWVVEDDGFEDFPEAFVGLLLEQGGQFQLIAETEDVGSKLFGRCNHGSVVAAFLHEHVIVLLELALDGSVVVDVLRRVFIWQVDELLHPVMETRFLELADAVSDVLLGLVIGKVGDLRQQLGALHDRGVIRRFAVDPDHDESADLGQRLRMVECTLRSRGRDEPVDLGLEFHVQLLNGRRRPHLFDGETSHLNRAPPIRFELEVLGEETWVHLEGLLVVTPRKSRRIGWPVDHLLLDEQLQLLTASSGLGNEPVGFPIGLGLDVGDRSSIDRIPDGGGLGWLLPPPLSVEFSGRSLSREHLLVELIHSQSLPVLSAPRVQIMRIATHAEKRRGVGFISLMTVIHLLVLIAVIVGLFLRTTATSCPAPSLIIMRVPRMTFVGSTLGGDDHHGLIDHTIGGDVESGLWLGLLGLRDVTNLSLLNKSARDSI